jgi:hypothetical protein
LRKTEAHIAPMIQLVLKTLYSSSLSRFLPYVSQKPASQWQIAALQRLFNQVSGLLYTITGIRLNSCNKNKYIAVPWYSTGCVRITKNLWCSNPLYKLTWHLNVNYT